MSQETKQDHGMHTFYISLVVRCLRIIKFSVIFFTSFVFYKSGGVAGLVVDIVLFPIDTIKTRLQSEKGLWRSGGFRGIYNGLGPAAAGSAPTGK